MVFLEEERTKGDMQKEESNAKMEAENGVMFLQAKEHQGLLATTKSSEKGIGWFLPQSLQN